MIQAKIKEWGKRYLPAEVLALIGALSGGVLVNLLFHNPILTAYGGTWGENTGYYGYFFYEEFKERRKKEENNIKGLFKVLRNMVMEFGVGEYLDGLVIRPTAMYLFPKLLNNLTLGLIVGKYSADIIFYIPTIISYEFKKKIIKD